jgi:hypothetical protein
VLIGGRSNDKAWHTTPTRQWQRSQTRYPLGVSLSYERCPAQHVRPDARRRSSQGKRNRLGTAATVRALPHRARLARRLLTAEHIEQLHATVLRTVSATLCCPARLPGVNCHPRRATATPLATPHRNAHPRRSCGSSTPRMATLWKLRTCWRSPWACDRASCVDCAGMRSSCRSAAWWSAATPSRRPHRCDQRTPPRPCRSPGHQRRVTAT